MRSLFWHLSSVQKKDFGCKLKKKSWTPAFSYSIPTQQDIFLMICERAYLNLLKWLPQSTCIFRLPKTHNNFGCSRGNGGLSNYQECHCFQCFAIKSIADWQRHAWIYTFHWIFTSINASKKSIQVGRIHFYTLLAANPHTIIVSRF